MVKELIDSAEKKLIQVVQDLMAVFATEAEKYVSVIQQVKHHIYRLPLAKGEDFRGYVKHLLSRAKDRVVRIKKAAKKAILVETVSRVTNRALTDLRDAEKAATL